jgi:DNA-binding NarL/FixJ family response regulator
MTCASSRRLLSHRAWLAQSRAAFSQRPFVLVLNPGSFVRKNSGAMRLLVIDERVMPREALAALLERHGHVVVGALGDHREAAPIVAQARIDAALVHVAGDVGALRCLMSATRVIVLSACTADVAPRCLDAGAVGFLSKHAGLRDLELALDKIASGERFVAPASGNDGEARSLTPREREVLRLLADGLSSKEIAQSLGVAVATVATHRRQIGQRLGLRSVAALTKWAIRTGLTSFEA